MAGPLHDLATLPLGTITQAKTEGAPLLKWVYQRVHPDYGNLPSPIAAGLQIRAHVIPYDPETPAQLSRRELFRLAVLDYQGLTQPERDALKQEAVPLNMTGFNLHISRFMTDPDNEPRRATVQGLQLQPATVASTAHWQNPPP